MLLSNYYLIRLSPVLIDLDQALPQRLIRLTFDRMVPIQMLANPAGRAVLVGLIAVATKWLRLRSHR